MPKIDHVERASRAWPILVKAALHDDRFLSYKELGDQIGIHHRAVRFVLGVIQDLCLIEKLPPLTIMVVNSSGLPGAGFIAHDINKFDAGVDLVRSYDWSAKTNPFALKGEGMDMHSIIRRLKNDPNNSGDIYHNVKSRGMQQILFRDALRDIYNNKCAFSGIEFCGSLEACHIKPWAACSPEERLDIRNGVLLNRLHHKLFDDHYFTINKHHKILFWDPAGKFRKYSEIEKQLTLQLHKTKMTLPFRVHQRPSDKYLAYHSAGFEYYS